MKKKDVGSTFKFMPKELASVLSTIYQRSPFYDYTLVNHANFVAALATQRTMQLGGNPNVAYLAGWFHDVGAAIKGPEDHHKTGAEIAGKMLREFGYPEDVIKPVQYCILVHRASIEGERETIEAKCVASADGRAHLYQIPALFSIAYLRLGLSSLEAAEWVKGKLKRSWNKLLPVDQEEMRKKYEAAMELLDGSGKTFIW